MGQRFAYAIDHTPGPDGNGDPELRKAADLMRSWDGRLTTDSAAASLVTQTRAALWPMILEPKLGKLADDYHWSESNFAVEEIVMHAKPEWLPKDYKNWDALLTAAVRKGMHDGKAPADVEPVDLRKLARGRYRASARRVSSLHQPHRRHRARSRKAATAPP